MPISFIPQDIFSIAKQGLMVTGKISGGEVKAGMLIKVGEETGTITKVDQRTGVPTVGLMIRGVQLETLQGKTGQSLTITG
jgi:translation elongation factor EF-Tu-like GTPase